MKNGEEHKEYVSVDFTHNSPKFEYFKDGNSIKKWSTKKADSHDMILKIIEGQGMSNFEANRIKSMVILGLEKFSPKTVKIIKKETNE